MPDHQASGRGMPVRSATRRRSSVAISMPPMVDAAVRWSNLCSTISPACRRRACCAAAGSAAKASSVLRSYERIASSRAASDWRVIAAHADQPVHQIQPDPAADRPYPSPSKLLPRGRFPPVAMVGHDILKGIADWCPVTRGSFQPDQPGLLERGQVPREPLQGDPDAASKLLLRERSYARHCGKPAQHDIDQTGLRPETIVVQDAVAHDGDTRVAVDIVGESDDRSSGLA